MQHCGNLYMHGMTLAIGDDPADMPLPYDDFAPCSVGEKAICEKGQRGRRVQGTQRKPRGEAFAKRVLDVVEVFGVLDFSSPLHCQGISASSSILQRCSSRTPWHFVPRDDDFALALPENGTKHQKHGQASSGPKAIAPRCGREPSVVSGKSTGSPAA